MMSAIEAKVNHKVLKWARRRSKMSPLDVAIELCIGLFEIERWEKGISYPSFAQLDSMCALYNLPSAIFFFPKVPTRRWIKKQGF